MDLENRDAQAVLEKSLGQYDPSSWRFFEYRNVASDLATAPISITPGEAYWMISKNQLVLDWGAGSSIRTDSVFAISLHAGWTLIGSPFNFDVRPELLKTRSGQPLDIRRYDGAWTAHSDSVLHPFEGYAIHNSTGSVDILYIAPSSEIAELSDLFEATASKNRASVDWSIPIHARMGRARDIDNVAAAGSSLLNRADPPPVGNYVRLAFDGRDYPLSTAGKLVDGAAQTWSFNVSSEEAGTVTVQFPDLGEVPEGYAVTLVDPATGIQQDLRSDPTFNVASVGAGIERTLHLEVDPQGAVAAELPIELKLHPAFPNPFAASTTIQYSLPEASNVELEVFDILGRKVVTLAHGDMQAGNHILVWDGRTEHGHDTAPGVYVARFRSTDHTETITMTRTR